MGINPYKRPTDEHWMGLGGQEPTQTPGGMQVKSPYHRAKDERWYGPLETKSVEGTLSYTINLFYSPLYTAECYPYMKEKGKATCYPLNTPVGALSWSVDFAGNQQITGVYTAEKTFYAWRNQINNNNPQDTNEGILSVTNIGTGSLFVNGVEVLPGGFSPFVNVKNAGYNNGDQSAYAGGTRISVTS